MSNPHLDLAASHWKALFDAWPVKTKAAIAKVMKEHGEQFHRMSEIEKWESVNDQIAAFRVWEADYAQPETGIRWGGDL